MEYKVEQVAADKYVVMYKKPWLLILTRWYHVKHQGGDEIRYFSTKRAAQAYVNYQTNPNMRWK